jgi:glycosyltransferase 2 family protein
VIKRKILLDILKYILFFGIGIALFIWVYRGQDMGSILEGLTRFHFGWIAASFVVFLLSHFFRAIRWRMLIQSIGYKPGLFNTFLSILVMYLANAAVTRMGEVTRCGILKKYEGVPFTPQLGTVLVERMVDLLFLLIILAAALFLSWDILSTFFDGSTGGVDSSRFSFLTSPFFLIIAGLLVAGAITLFLLRHKIKATPLAVKILSYAGKFAEGLKSIFRLKQPVVFVLLTIGIYGCYYLGTFFILKAFAPTSALSPIVAFSVLASGSIGMLVPVPAGFGSFHFFAWNTLLLYGVASADGQLVTLVLHGSTTLFIIVVGAIALGILPIYNKKKTPA